MLVQIRKLIEDDRADASLKGAFFMCDWIVHNSLERNPWAKEILNYANEVMVTGLPWHLWTDEMRFRLTEHFGLENVRVSLMHACRRNHIAPIVFGHSGGWRAFLQVAAKIVEDCPLVLKTAALIEELRFDLEDAAYGPNTMSFNWSGKRRDDREGFIWKLPVVFGRPYYAFGSRGQETIVAFERALKEAGF